MQPEDGSEGVPQIMGIVNVTPDSFSDGGRYLSLEKALDHALQLVEEGAHILDIGGESTRPGAQPVSPDEEQDRILPVIEGLKASGCAVLISADTRNASTMRACLSAGIEIVNDISALRHDPDSIEIVRKSNCRVCLMHMQGTPETMQENPRYANVVEEVFEFLSNRISTCETAGIAKNRLIADPGIGFGKDQGHNLALLANLARFHELGVPLLLGASRKGFIGRADTGPNATDRLGGSIAVALHGLIRGAGIVRVHDVAQTRQAFAVWKAINSL
jgi:dihydropteroate synthase